MILSKVSKRMTMIKYLALCCLLSTPALAEEGKASWYGPGFHGRQTASGEIFNTREYTAAHKTLPFGTKVIVENLSNGLWLEVRINDRGPFIRGRIIDLSKAAADELRIKGLANVRLHITY